MNNVDALKQQGDVIWNIANLLRGPYRPPQYRRVMIPLTVLRRLDCVLESSKDKVVAMHKKLKAEGKDDEYIEKVICHKFKLAFYNTSEFTFPKLLGDPDKLAANLKLVKGHCEAYLAAEVLPYRPDAWIAHDKTRVGYEIPFNRHFYEYEAPRPLADIEADIADMEKEIVAMLGEITA